MLARLVSVTLPDSDGDGPLAAPVTQYAFDAVGNLLEVTDALDNVTTHQYDHLHRRVQTQRPDPDGAGPLDRPTISMAYNLGVRAK
jgi:YD repeat-containing protein